MGASARRFVIVPDGLLACAALSVASAVAPAVVEYCVHARSDHLRGLDVGVSVGMEAIDGTGATLIWPLISTAASLLAAPR